MIEIIFSSAKVLTFIGNPIAFMKNRACIIINSRTVKVLKLKVKCV